MTQAFHFLAGRLHLRRAPSFARRTAMAFVLSLGLSTGCQTAESSPGPIGSTAQPAPLASERIVLIVLDGLRPDYVTPELMPRLSELRAGGSWGTNHHAVFPTLTRVNAPSIATGTRPGQHGLMENTVFVPELGEGGTISTGDAESLRRAEGAIGRSLLTVPDLAEILDGHGRVLMVASSGSSGSAFLLNHRTPSGPIVNTELVLPETLSDTIEHLFGPSPLADRPNLLRNRRAVDAFLEYGLASVEPDVVLMWLSDPDNTAHSEGIGSEATRESIRAVDAEVGRLVDTLRERGLLEGTDLIITSDHGFSTHVGTVRVDQYLVDRGLKAGIDSNDVVVAGGGIHVLRGGPERVTAIARALQEAPWAGALFSKGLGPDDLEGWVPGTLSYASIRYDHARAPDLYVSANWSDEPNELGWPGTSWQLGTAGHGTSSPWDIHATLLAHGPSFRAGFEGPLPTGHHDLAPTILHLQGLPVPAHMEGRVLTELLREAASSSLPDVRSGSHSVRSQISGGEYHLTLHTSVVNGSYYVASTVTERR